MKGWLVTETDLEYMALGAAVLGTGGGGNAYLGKLRAREQLRAGKRIRVIPPEALAVVGPGAFGYDVDYQPLGDYAAPRAR